MNIDGKKTWKINLWDRKDYLEAKKIRDQAFTHLKEAVDYIGEFGKFVFRRNVDRLKGYRSNYSRMKKMRWKRRNNVPGLDPANTDLNS
jgi:hypothetical protein